MSILRPKPQTILQTLAPALLAACLAGCVGLADSDAMRLCRSLIPALDRDAQQVRIAATHETKTTRDGTFAVAVDYEVGGHPPEARRIACEFATRDWPTPQAGIEALKAVSTDTAGSLGPLRLQLLKRHWLERGEAAGADPAPYSSFGAMPEVARGTALALQTALGAAPIVSIYALLAGAYALIYGLLGRINLAVGELTMLAGYGAFLGSALTLGTTPSVLLAIVFGLFTALAHGHALGRVVVMPLTRAPGQHLLIATLGLALAWSEAVRLLQGSGNRWMPPVLNRPWALVRSGDLLVTVTPMALLVAAVAGAASLALLYAMARSRFGRRWRAFAEDARAAALLGISPQGVIAATMLAAAALTGLAGILTMLYYGGVGFSGGLATGLKALVGAIVGGLALPRTALLGGIVLGVAEASWSAVFPIEYRDAAIYVALAVTLALRPEGLFTRDVEFMKAAEPGRGRMLVSGVLRRPRYRNPRSSR